MEIRYNISRPGIEIFPHDYKHSLSPILITEIKALPDDTDIWWKQPKYLSYHMEKELPRKAMQLDANENLSKKFLLCEATEIWGFICFCNFDYPTLTNKEKTDNNAMYSLTTATYFT